MSVTRLGPVSFLGFGLAALLLRGAAGCSAQGGAINGFSSDNNESSGSGSLSSGSGSGNPGSGGNNPFGTSGSGTSSGGLTPDAACATSNADATLVPVNMFIMFDDSGSMGDDNKWNDASAALKTFFGDPDTAGLRVALRFFPDGGCNDPQCDVSACQSPEVGIGALTADPAPMDTQEAALVNAVNAHGPADSGGTPMSAAVQGAENFATQFQSSHPTEKMVVVLVTDGQPSGCDESIDDIANTASQALGSNGVMTYAVGLEGSAEAQMDQIAVAGGTTQAFFIGTGSNAVQQLVDSLKAIQGSSVACEFSMPTSNGNGKPVDPSLVNVNYTPGTGGPTETFGQVPNKNACGTSDGWYYDNNQDPTSITLCPSTCTEVQADKGAKIQILLGCGTKSVQ